MRARPTPFLPLVHSPRLTKALLSSYYYFFFRSFILQAEGTHTPAMFAECIKELGVARFPNGVFVDGTFGRGGHTRKVLEALGPTGELHAFDMDEEAVEVGVKRNKPVLWFKPNCGRRTRGS